MKKIYLASAYDTKQEVRKISAQLIKDGFELTSQWIYEPHLGIDEIDDSSKMKIAVRDRFGVLRSDLLIQLNHLGGVSGGGKHSELGFAVAASMLDIAFMPEVWVVGKTTNIFTYLPEVTRFKTWKDCYKELEKFKE